MIQSRDGLDSLPLSLAKRHMRVMIRRGSEIPHKLVRLARGDVGLVEQALEKAGSGDRGATVTELIRFIQARSAQASGPIPSKGEREYGRNA